MQELIPVVAIGASAGGLNPLEQFFDTMRPDTGCAFVVIQHLSPDFRSLMDELLAKRSSMAIYRVVDGMKLDSNAIYLNPPRSFMTVDKDVLKVEDIGSTEITNLPIDVFFRSLAESRKSDATAVVLSGTGTDGTLGSVAIAEVGGKVLVQDPNTTRFNGMPKSVMNSGKYNLVAPPNLLAKNVLKILRGKAVAPEKAVARETIENPYDDLLSMLKHEFGTNFFQYKVPTITRRIERRARMKGIESLKHYRDFVKGNSSELPELYADLLIEVTSFFRDEEAFRILKNDVIPSLFDEKNQGDSIRVWVPGCASGEEAYSIAILLQEHAREMKISFHIKILATDIHIRSMSQANSGTYPLSALKKMPQNLVHRYFDIDDDEAQIKPSLRNMVFFSTHDLMRDPPFTRIDLVSCRNLLIYLMEVAQDKVMSLLHFALRKDGVLFLGPSEHIGSISHEFQAISEKWRVFRKLRDVKLLPIDSIFQRDEVPRLVERQTITHKASFVPTGQAVRTDLRAITHKRAKNAALEEIVRRYAPAGFLVAIDGALVHIFGSAGELLSQREGECSDSIVDLIKSEFKISVVSVLEQGRVDGFTGINRTVHVKSSTDQYETYEIGLENVELADDFTKFQLLTIIKNEAEEATKSNLNTSRELTAALVDVTHPLQDRVQFLESSLKSSEESLQSTIEELESSNEELQSTNEELMSTNEELQSTNEELHSVNEELYTVSAEHQRKNHELTERNKDVDVLLSSSKIGTIHLDSKLVLRRYSKNSEAVFNLLPQDIGRPISHITFKCDDVKLQDIIVSVHEKGLTKEINVFVDKRYYLIRIMPYLLDSSSTTEGVLITVIDVTDMTNMHNLLLSMNEQYRSVVDSTQNFIARWDAETHRITFCNRPFSMLWGKQPADILHKNIVALQSTENREQFESGFMALSAGESLIDVNNFSLQDSGSTLSAMVTIEALSRDGEITDEFQLVGVDYTKEHEYSQALDRLLDGFHGNEQNTDETLNHILNVALRYFGLDSAIVGMANGKKFQLTHIHTTGNSKYRTGDSYQLSETLSKLMSEKDKFMAFDGLSGLDAAATELANNTSTQSFIGAPIHTSYGPYGTVSFSANKPRGREFSANEINFCIMVSGWLGFILGHAENIQFVKQQSDFYKTLFVSIPANVFLATADGLVITASEKLSESLSDDIDSVPGMRVKDFLTITDINTNIMQFNEGVIHKAPCILKQLNQVDVPVVVSSSIKTVGGLQGVRVIVMTEVAAGFSK